MYSGQSAVLTVLLFGEFLSTSKCKAAQLRTKEADYQQEPTKVYDQSQDGRLSTSKVFPTTNSHIHTAENILVALLKPVRKEVSSNVENIYVVLLIGISVIVIVSLFVYFKLCRTGDADNDADAAAGQAWQPTPPLALKVVYFCSLGVVACLSKYIPILYMHAGLTNFEIGVLLTIAPVACFCGQFVAASFCDWSGMFKQTLVVLHALMVVFVWSMSTSVIHNVKWHLGLVSVFALVLLAACRTIQDVMMLQAIEEHQLVWIQSPRCNTARGLSQAPPPTVLFGNQRLWGTIGFAGASLLGGGIMDAGGVYAICIFSACLMTISGCTVAMAYSNRAKVKEAAKGSFMELLATFEVQWFVANLFVTGACACIVENFLFLFLKQRFPTISNFFLGCCVAVMCLFELPVFAYADKLFSCVDLRLLLTFAHLVFAVRCIAYVFLHSPFMVLLVEPLHGVTFALMWCTTVELGKRLATPGTEAKMQAMVGGVYNYLAMSMGALVWGNVTQPSPQGLGFSSAFVAAAALIIGWSCLWNLISYSCTSCFKSELK